MSARETRSVKISTSIARRAARIKRNILMSRPRFLALLSVVFLAGLWLQPLVSTQVPPPKRSPEELRRLSIAAETSGLAEPFKGITTTGQIEPGLFGIRSTGVS